MNYFEREKVLIVLRIFVITIGVALILFLLFLKIYYGKMDNGKEQSKYLLHVNYLERIAEVMREKNSFIPLYQIYIDEAVYWDTLSLEKGQTEVVPFEVFNKICNVIAQYDNIKKEVVLYRKNNENVKIIFKLEDEMKKK